MLCVFCCGKACSKGGALVASLELANGYIVFPLVAVCCSACAVPIATAFPASLATIVVCDVLPYRVVVVPLFFDGLAESPTPVKPQEG